MVPDFGPRYCGLLRQDNSKARGKRQVHSSKALIELDFGGNLCQNDCRGMQSESAIMTTSGFDICFFRGRF